jgi:hypothetical protein
VLNFAGPKRSGAESRGLTANEQGSDDPAGRGGNWQYNWKTDKAYAGTCRTMVLTLSDNTTHSATFKFK